MKIILAAAAGLTAALAAACGGGSGGPPTHAEVMLQWPAAAGAQVEAGDLSGKTPDECKSLSRTEGMKAVLDVLPEMSSSVALSHPPAIFWARSGLAAMINKATESQAHAESCASARTRPTS